MTTERVSLNGGWTGFQTVNGDANTATSDLIKILDAVEVPIVVLGRDFAILCFNKAAADLLGLSPSDIGRPSRDISVLAGLPGLEQQCSQVITSGVDSRADFRHGDMWFVVRISPYTKSDRHVTGTVLTFANVTAFRASIDQAIYERECTKAILNTVADPLVVLSADQRIQSGNRAFYTMFGISRDEMQGVPLYELGTGAFEPSPLREQLKEMLAGIHAFQPVEVDHVFTAKGQRTLILDAHPLSFPGHSERRILVTFQDITERKQAGAAQDLRAEHELRRREAKIQRLIETNVVGIIMWNLEGAITGANEAFLRMLQYDREDLTSGRLRWTNLTPAEWHERDERAIAELKASGAFQPYEKEYLRKDGSRVPILLGGALSEGSGNEGVSFMLDLSEQKRAERALRCSEERWRLVFENSAIGVALSDLNGRFIATNPVYQKMLGYTGEELQNLTFLDITLEEFRDPNWSLIGDLLERKVQQFQIEKQYRRKDGSLVWVHNNVSIVPGTKRVPQFLMALSEDITDRKRAEDELRSSEERHRLVVETASDAVVSVDENGTIRFANSSVMKIFGYDPTELIGKPLTMLMPEYKRKPYESGFRSYLANGQWRINWEGVELTAFRKNGKEFPVEISFGELTRDGQSVITGFIRDISEKKRAEEALRASEQDFRLIVDTIPGMVCMLKADWEVEFVNKPLREYFGMTLEELKNWEFIGVVHPDDIERVVAKTRHSAATGEPYDVEHRCLRHDGVFRWFQLRAMPLRDVAGHIVRWYVLVTDIEDRKRAEEALEARERNLSLIINTMPVLAWSARPDGSAEFLSRRWLEYTGFSAEQAKDWGWTAALHRDDAEGLLKLWQSSLVSGEPMEAEARMRRFDGAYRWLLFRTSALRAESGNIVKWYGTAADIEDRKQAEQQLRRNEWNLLEAQRLGHSGSWSLDVSSGRVTTTPEILRTYDVTPGEETSNPDFWFSRIHHEDRKWVQELFEKCLAEKTDYDAVYRVLRPDGSIRHQHFIGRPIINDSGYVVEFMGAAIDITEQVEAREALLKAFAAIEKSEDQLRAIISTIPALVWSAAPDGSAEFFNQRWLDYTGLAAEQARDWGWRASIHPGDLEHVTDYWKSVIVAGEPLEVEARIRRVDGEYRWFLIRADPLRDESGNIMKWYGTNTDIDDRKRAEMALQDAMQERTRLAAFRAEIEMTLSRREDLKGILHGCANAVVRHLDAAFARIWILSSDGRELELHASAGKYTRLDGSHSRIQVGQLKIGLIAEERKSYFTNDVQNDPRVSDKDWARRENMVSFAGYPMILEDRLVGVIGMFAQKPLTESTLEVLAFAAGVIAQGIERKRAEESLKLQVHVLQSMPGNAWTVLPDGTPDFTNQQWLEYAGQTLDCARSSPEAWMTVLHPDDRERAAAAYWEGVRSGNGFTSEARFRRSSDGEYRWHLSRAIPLRDSAGNLIKLVGTSTDIEDVKRAEEALQSTQAQLAHVTRVASMGEIAASIAHEVNQPLSGVTVNAKACLNWLAANPPDLVEVRETVQRIVRDGQRAGDVIARIRALATKKTTEKERLDLNEDIQDVIALVQGLVRRNKVTLRMDLSENLPPVLGDRIQLQQVVLNLVVNAIEAMAAVAGRQKELGIATRVIPNGIVQVAVCDSGPGVDTESLQKIFEAFYTTKPEGMGMGLSISRTIVRNHGGRLWATRNDGPGTTFSFTVPTSQ